MTVIRWKPASASSKVDVNHNPWGDDYSPKTFSQEKSFYEFEPHTNIVETDNGYQISIELPGVKKEDVKISFLENVLTVKGEKKNSEKVDEDKYYRIERRFGSFERNFRLPNEIDAKNTKATFTNGVLGIDLTKKEEEKPKEISINVK